MKLHQLVLITTLAASLSGCNSTIEARHSYDSETDFSSLASYDWLPVKQAIFSTPESAEHYRSAMDNMLASKGFNPNTESPDFLIKTQRVETYREKYVSIYGLVEFPKAMIRIDLLRPSSNEVIYEGAADAYFDVDASQQKKNTTIDRAVEALLGGFPPGSQ